MNRKLNIVEDDVFIAQDLCEMLAEMDYTVLSVSHTAAEALSSLKKEKPDLILMDINLNDAIDGVHLAGIVKTEYKIPVVFTTAFSDQATLERVKNISPYGYVVKPYTAANIKVAVELAFSRLDGEKNVSVNEDNPASFINSANGMIKIIPQEILYIHAYDYYANVFTPTEKILAKMTLGEVLETINDDDLVRVHKSYAVNIKKVEKIKNNEIHIGAVRIPIGRAFKEELKNKIKVI